MFICSYFYLLSSTGCLDPIECQIPILYEGLQFYINLYKNILNTYATKKVQRGHLKGKGVFYQQKLVENVIIRNYFISLCRVRSVPFKLVPWRRLSSCPQGRQEAEEGNQQWGALSVFLLQLDQSNFPFSVACTGVPYKILFEKRILMLNFEKSCLIFSDF